MSNKDDTEDKGAESKDSADYQLRSLDDWRLRYIQQNTTPDGQIVATADPKVVLKAINDTATSLSRRQAQELASAEAASADQYRSRALSVVEAAVDNGRKFLTTMTGAPLSDSRKLPSLPEFDDIGSEESSNGIVRLDPKNFGG